MSEVIPFEEEAGKEPDGDVGFRLDLEGYEGPIDVLLQLARDQKVDITRLSILDLAEQYLEFVRRARNLRLELAADYLVMAAWLAYLKSRLLIPVAASDDEPSGAEMAAALKFQLQRLEAMQDAGARLMARSQLGQEVFARGQPEPLRRLTHASYEATLFELLSAYVRHHARVEATSLQIAPLGLYSVEDALRRLSGLMGATPNWRTLATFLPTDLQGGLLWRSAMASTLAASLEMCREGKLQIRQDGPFGQIYLRGVAENP